MDKETIAKMLREAEDDIMMTVKRWPCNVYKTLAWRIIQELKDKLHIHA